MDDMAPMDSSSSDDDDDDVPGVGTDDDDLTLDATPVALQHTFSMPSVLSESRVGDTPASRSPFAADTNVSSPVPEPRDDSCVVSGASHAESAATPDSLSPFVQPPPVRRRLRLSKQSRKRPRSVLLDTPEGSTETGGGESDAAPSPSPSRKTRQRPRRALSSSRTGAVRRSTRSSAVSTTAAHDSDASASSDEPDIGLSPVGRDASTSLNNSKEVHHWHCGLVPQSAAVPGCCLVLRCGVVWCGVVCWGEAWLSYLHSARKCVLALPCLRLRWLRPPLCHAWVTFSCRRVSRVGQDFMLALKDREKKKKRIERKLRRQGLITHAGQNSDGDHEESLDKELHAVRPVDDTARLRRHRSTIS